MSFVINLALGICGFLVVFGCGELLERKAWNGLICVFSAIAPVVAISLLGVRQFDWLIYGGVVGFFVVVLFHWDALTEIVREHKLRQK